MFNNPDSGAKFRIISLQFKRWSMVYTEVWSRLPRGFNPPGPLEVTRPKDGGKSVWDFWIYKFMITLRERTQFTRLRFGSRPLTETHPAGRPTGWGLAWGGRWPSPSTPGRTCSHPPRSCPSLRWCRPHRNQLKQWVRINIVAWTLTYWFKICIENKQIQGNYFLDEKKNPEEKKIRRQIHFLFYRKKRLFQKEPK